MKTKTKIEKTAKDFTTEEIDKMSNEELLEVCCGTLLSLRKHFQEKAKGKAKEEFLKEFEASLPKSCVKCVFRNIDGGPEGHPICIHPSLKIRESQYIIDFWKNPPDKPHKCPLKGR